MEKKIENSVSIQLTFDEMERADYCIQIHRCPSNRTCESMYFTIAWNENPEENLKSDDFLSFLTNIS